MKYHHLLLAGTCCLPLISACLPHYLAPGNITTTPHLIEQDGNTALITRDNTRLAWQTWHPVADMPPRAMLLGLHSYGDFRLAYAPLGPWLAQQGIVSYAYDQRGFGESDDKGLWPEGALLINDLIDAIQVLRQRHPELPLILAGESMGGSVVLTALAEHPELDVRGAILAAPGVRGGIRLRYLYNAGLWLTAHLAPNQTLSVPRQYPAHELLPTSAARLSNDSRVIHEVRFDAYYGLIRFTDRASDSVTMLSNRGTRSSTDNDPGSNPHTSTLPPTLLLHGGSDTTVPRVAIKRLVNDWPKMSRPTLEVHYLPDAPHLILQWSNEAKVRELLHDWLETQLPAL
ncbi:alpha/beta fold hydrolase [Cobetia crustatorum]|uniref:Lysophospholipase n=1 Tax=Cobetia crustatorum TaxID=553385 RepID=A0A558HWY2_9GAMM|nr:alpha/beta fold hydrolase [Cobetia crustatorum]TVU73631.1 lysophospholipase [Cobetia crustatorum]